MNNILPLTIRSGNIAVFCGSQAHLQRALLAFILNGTMRWIGSRKEVELVKKIA